MQKRTTSCSVNDVLSATSHIDVILIMILVLTPVFVVVLNNHPLMDLVEIYVVSSSTTSLRDGPPFRGEGAPPFVRGEEGLFATGRLAVVEAATAPPPFPRAFPRGEATAAAISPMSCGSLPMLIFRHAFTASLAGEEEG